MLHLGVVGCGRVFERFHLPALRRAAGCRLAATCDTDPERRAWVKRTLPDLPCYGDGRAMMGACRDAGRALDAVLVLTPPPTHAEESLAALGAGCHVLVEKPMATAGADATAMRAAACEHGARLAVGFTRRFRVPYLALRRALRALPSGAIASVRSELVVNARQWRVAAAGGSPWGNDVLVLDDVSCHQIDLVSWLLDVPMRAARARRAEPAPELGRWIEIAMRVDADIEVHLRSGRAAHYTDVVEVILRDGSALVAGPNAMARSRRGLTWARQKLRWMEGAELVRRRALHAPGVTAESFAAQLAAFTALVASTPLDGRDPPASANEGVHSVAVADACRASLEHAGAWCEPRAA